MDISQTHLFFGLLVFLLIASAFFSGSETAMVALNRYRLKHLAKSGNKAAKRVEKLQTRIDKLLSTVLIGNNFANIYAATLATLLAIEWFGSAGAAIAPIFLTIFVLIFAEVTPKVYAANHPERFAFPASIILMGLMWALAPLNWLVNGMSNLMLRMLGIASGKGKGDSLSPDELRIVVNEASNMVPENHRSMLLSILDLENITVEDIMIPRNEIVGIDLADDLNEILGLIRAAPHTRLLVYRDDPNNVIGMLHLRRLSRLLERTEITKEDIEALAGKPYYIPEGTKLSHQLVHFQNLRKRIGIIVDEYGEVLGLVTLEDILEEIVGEFTTNLTTTHADIQPQPDGSFLIDGGMHLRDINRVLHWKLPTDGPRTLNGLILEHLQSIPESSVSIKVDRYLIEVVQLKDNAIKTVRVALAPVHSVV